MSKSILITGSTDGIGLQTAKKLYLEGHNVILHGRNSEKLNKVEEEILATGGSGSLQKYTADLSIINNVVSLAEQIKSGHKQIDVLINNAGVYVSPVDKTNDGLDIRFAVNTIAPYLLTKSLLPILKDGRVINVSSAAQAPVSLDALSGNEAITDKKAYAQSKLAMIMWAQHMLDELNANNTTIISVNPGSLLATKMVKEAFNMDGDDISKGANILSRCALDEKMLAYSGEYFDNDSGQFAKPYRDALDKQKCMELVEVLESIIQ